MSDEDDYPPESIRALKGIDPPGRDPADPIWRHAGEFLKDPKQPLHSPEDGPGSGVRIELTVRVLLGTERSTIVVADPISGQALEHDVVQHGGEAGAAAMAVYTALKKRDARL